MNIPSGIKPLEKCCQRGSSCCVKLDNIKISKIYKGEQLTLRVMGEQKKACDCFIFYDGSRVVLVELKSKKTRYSSIQEKFANGVEVVNSVLGETTYSKIVLLLLAKAFNQKPSISYMANNLSIKINGKRKSIRYDKCGAQLANILAKK